MDLGGGELGYMRTSTCSEDLFVMSGHYDMADRRDQNHSRRAATLPPNKTLCKTTKLRVDWTTLVSDDGRKGDAVVLVRPLSVEVTTLDAIQEMCKLLGAARPVRRAVQSFPRASSHPPMPANFKTQANYWCCISLYTRGPNKPQRTVWTNMRRRLEPGWD